MRRYPVLPLVIIATLAVFTGFAPLIAPHDPLQALSLDDRTTPPSWLDSRSIFLLGTDHLGRDVLSRIVYGARISLLVSLSVLSVGVLVGTVLGAPVLRRIPETDFRRLLAALLVVLGLGVIVGAGAG